MNINVTLFFQMVFFILFVWFSKKYVWAPVIDALNKRKNEIADGLAAAEKGQAAETEAKVAAEEVIAQAKSQAGEIIARAEKRGSEMVEEAKTTAKVEAERIKDSATAEIDTEVNKAKEALRGQVSELAVAGARQILNREVDAKAHSEILDKLASQL